MTEKISVLRLTVTIGIFTILTACAQAPVTYSKAEFIQPTMVEKKETPTETSKKIATAVTHQVISALQIDSANINASRKAESAQLNNAIVVFPYEEGYLYKIYTSPLNITDLAFQPGEQIISVAAGDTARWQLTKTVSNTQFADRVEHLLLKPYLENISTTLAVMTNLRSYHLLLNATEKTFMVEVRWEYKADKKTIAQSVKEGVTQQFDLQQLQFTYQAAIKQGKRPAWMPDAIFHDNKKTYIRFPEQAQNMPVLFIQLKNTKDIATVNYRVMNNMYVIDEIIQVAELRSSDAGTIVTITNKVQA